MVGQNLSRGLIPESIDWMMGFKRKKESSDGIREFERDVDQNSGGLREIWPAGEYLDRRPTPKVAGEDEKGKEARPERKEEKKKTLGS